MQSIQFRSDIDIECPICLNHIGHGDSITILPCSHYFCGNCITEWSKVDNVCPICRNSNDNIPLNVIHDDVTMLMINDHNRYVQLSQVHDPVIHLNLNFESCHDDYIKIVVKDLPNDTRIIYPWLSIGNNRRISLNVYNLMNISCISVYLRLNNYHYKFHLEHDVNDVYRLGTIVSIDIDGTSDIVARSNVAGQRTMIVEYGSKHRRYCPNCHEDTGTWFSDYWSDDCDEIYAYECNDLDLCVIL